MIELVQHCTNGELNHKHMNTVLILTRKYQKLPKSAENLPKARQYLLYRV